MAAANKRSERFGFRTIAKTLIPRGPLAVLGFALNALAILIVLGFVVFGTRDVMKSQQLAENARLEVEQLKGEQTHLIEAVTELRNEKAILLEHHNRLEVEVLKLEGQLRELSQDVKESDPDVVIAKTRKQLGGKTPGERADSFWRVGRDAYAAGNVKVAERLFEESLKEQATFAPAHIGLGRLAADSRQFRTAEKFYRRARAADPENPHAAYNLALTHFILREYGEARDAARTTLKIDRDYEPAKELLEKIKTQAQLLKNPN